MRTLAQVTVGVDIPGQGDMRHPSDVLIGLDVGPFAVTAAAFDRDGRELGVASGANRVTFSADGGAEQDPIDCWQAMVGALDGLRGKVPDLARRTVALAVTGQADGTWLIDEDGDPLGALLWLDARAASLVAHWQQSGIADAVRKITGTPVSTALTSAQLAWLIQARPEQLAAAAAALHGKDWLYFCMTGERATDAVEAVATFGDFRTGSYAPEVLEILGLEEVERLLPPIIGDHCGTLSEAASAATGLSTGTPVVLAPPSALCAALAAGLGMMPDDVGGAVLDDGGAYFCHCNGHAPPAVPEDGGAVSPFVPTGRWCRLAVPMAAAGSIDWLVDMCTELMGEAGLIGIPRSDLAELLDHRAADAVPGRLLFHPYMAPNGEQAPFVDASARGQFLGLSRDVTLFDMMRAVHEGVALALRDGATALEHRPRVLHVIGDATESPLLRQVLAGVFGVPVRRVERQAPAAAGAALFAALRLGQYPATVAAQGDWLVPWLGPREPPVAELQALYARLFDVYRQARQDTAGIWRRLDAVRRGA